MIGRIQARQDILQHVAVEGDILWERLTDGRELGFLLRAGEADVAALPGGDALLQGRVVEGATAPQDLLKRTLLGGRGPQLFLVRRAPRRLFAHVSVFSSRSTRAVDDQDVWLKPRQVRLTARAQAQRLTAGSFCQTPRE